MPKSKKPQIHPEGREQYSICNNYFPKECLCLPPLPLTKEKQRTLTNDNCVCRYKMQQSGGIAILRLELALSLCQRVGVELGFQRKSDIKSTHTK